MYCKFVYLFCDYLLSAKNLFAIYLLKRILHNRVWQNKSKHVWVLLKYNFKRTSAVITFGFLSSNNGVGHYFSCRCYTPTISFLFMALNPEICAVRFASGHIRVRCSSWINWFRCMIHPTGLLFYVKSTVLIHQTSFNF